MRLQLNISNLELIEKAPVKWWLTEDSLNGLLRCIFEQKIFKYNYFGYNDKFKPVNDFLDVVHLYKKIKKNYTFFTLSEQKNTEDRFLRIFLEDNQIGFNLTCKHELNLKFRMLLELMMAIFNEYNGKVVLGPRTGVFLLDFEFRHFRPKKNFKFLSSYGLVNVIDAKYFNKTPHLKVRGFEKLLYEKLPKGVERVSKDGLYVINWIGDFKNEQQISKALMKREEWMYEHLDLDLKEDFNKYGDHEIYHIGTLTNVKNTEKFFNYYKERTEVAYKLYVLDENQGIDNRTTKKLVQYLKSKHLDNGASIKEIMLIVSSREAAVLIQEKAKKLGVTKVLYLDDYANVWDMNPPGNWRN